MPKPKLNCHKCQDCKVRRGLPCILLERVGAVNNATPKEH